MRVLWFCNSLLPDHAVALGKPVSHRGGWMPALADALVADDRIQLAVATDVLGAEDGKTVVGGTRYYTVARRRGWGDRVRLPDKLVQSYRRVVNDFEPDLVHIHGTEYFHGLLTARAHITCPAVVSIQGIIDVCRRYWWGGLSYDEVAASRTMRDRLRRDGLLEQRRRLEHRAVVEREIFAAHSAFIGRTLWDRAHLSRLNPNATYYRCEELLRAPFAFAEWDIRRIQRQTIFASGASCPLKGFHVLIKAAALLRKAFPDVRVRVMMAEFYPGVSGVRRLWKDCRSRGYARYLTDLIHREGMAEHVIPLAPLDAQGVAAELRRAHAFVLPSLMENSPNSLAEAMMVGTPSAASYVGGIPTMACDGEAVLLFPPGDEALLAERLRTIFLKDDWAVGASRQTRTAALQRHSTRRIVDRMVEVYAAVAPGSGNALASLTRKALT